MKMEEERKHFEAWSKSLGRGVERDRFGVYHSLQAQEAWMGWMARVEFKNTVAYKILVEEK